MDWFNMQASDWTKLRRLSCASRWLLFEAITLLPVCDVFLRLAGYMRLRAFLESVRPASRPACRDAEKEARQTALIVSTAARRGLYRASCLRASVLLWWLLRRGGITADICFGVRTNGQKLEAHAWVEMDGAILNDQEDIRRAYSPLVQGLPPTMRGL
jgi:hypothetical protein